MGVPMRLRSGVRRQGWQSQQRKHYIMRVPIFSPKIYRINKSKVEWWKNYQ